MSNVVGLQPDMLLIRGTQARSLSLIYHEAMLMGVILTSRECFPFYFQGGLVQDPVVGMHELVEIIDFNSLYPNVMISENLCPTTLIRPDQWEKFAHIPQRIYKPLICDQDPDEADNDPFAEKPKKGKKKVFVHKLSENPDPKVEEILWREMETHFVEASVCKGVTSVALKKLLDARARVRKIVPTDDVHELVLDGRQLALKVSANALYGFYGTKKGGKKSCLEVAAVTTDVGRRSITRAKEFILANFDCTIVYGDTDSLIVKLHNVPREKLWEESWKVAKAASALFEGLVFAMEGMFTVLLVKHKHYAKRIHKPPGKDGIFTGEFVMGHGGRPKMEIKGLAPTRRDNCQWVRTFLADMLSDIMDGMRYYPLVHKLTAETVRLYSGEVPLDDLVMTKNMGSNYKSENAPMRQFARQMQEKGQMVNAGERHKFLVVMIPGVEKIGMKMLLHSLYSATPEAQRPRIDFPYYFKSLMKKADTYLGAAFRAHDEMLQLLRVEHSGRIIDARTPAKFLFKCINAPRDPNDKKPDTRIHNFLNAMRRITV